MNSNSADHQRFLSLLADHERALRKICWVYGRTAHDRDDLSQEIIGQLWASWPSYDPARPFVTWMYRVALNVAIAVRRKQQRRPIDPVDFTARDVPAPEADPVQRDDLAELHERLERFHEADRALLLLALEGHTYREIGTILGLTETNVGTRLNRLKQTLRDAVLPSPSHPAETPT